MSEQPSEAYQPYVASYAEHGAAVNRALAYLLLRAEGSVTYEQINGTIFGVEHNRVRFVFEAETGPLFTTMTQLRQRFGLPRARG